MLYLQISRGVARRDHAFPGEEVRPGLTMIARPFDFRSRLAEQRAGKSAITADDERWARRDIKSTALLPNILAKQAGRERGAYETIMIDPDGTVTEGASTTAWMVEADGTVATRPLSRSILPGLKRRRLISLLADAGMAAEERVYDRAALAGAKEIFVTSTSSPVMPIVRLDGQAVGGGVPGPVSLKACALMWDEIERQTGWRVSLPD
jgi:D-alanine transaminase